MSRSRLRSTPDDSLIVRSLALRLPPGHRIASHDHTWVQVVYAESGVMTVNAADQQWVVLPHRCLLLPRRRAHAISIVSRTSMRTLYLRPSLARELVDGIRVMDVAPLLRELILECVRVGALDRRAAEDRAPLHGADGSVVRAPASAGPAATRAASIGRGRSSHVCRPRLRIRQPECVLGDVPPRARGEPT